MKTTSFTLIAELDAALGAAARLARVGVTTDGVWYLSVSDRCSAGTVSKLQEMVFSALLGAGIDDGQLACIRTDDPRWCDAHMVLPRSA